jgi:hypothetical protein
VAAKNPSTVSPTLHKYASLVAKHLTARLIGENAIEHAAVASRSRSDRA